MRAETAPRWLAAGARVCQGQQWATFAREQQPAASLKCAIDCRRKNENESLDSVYKSLATRFQFGDAKED